jgi:hypothetical protein
VGVATRGPPTSFPQATWFFAVLEMEPRPCAGSTELSADNSGLCQGLKNELPHSKSVDLERPTFLHSWSGETPPFIA